MKKKLSLLAVAAITAFTMSVNAQTPRNEQQKCNEGKCPQTEQRCRQDKKCSKGDFKQMRQCKQCPDSMAAFKGIELTETQKSQIAQIRTDMMAARKAKAEAAKANKGDKADKAKGAEARMQAKLDYLHQVQKVLTPEQYITFLENTAVMNGPGQPKGDFRHGKGVRPGKGPKCDKQMEGCKDECKQGRPERKGRQQMDKAPKDTPVKAKK